MQLESQKSEKSGEKSIWAGPVGHTCGGPSRMCNGLVRWPRPHVRANFSVQIWPNQAWPLERWPRPLERSRWKISSNFCWIGVFPPFKTQSHLHKRRLKNTSKPEELITSNFKQVSKAQASSLKEDHKIMNLRCIQFSMYANLSVKVKTLAIYTSNPKFHARCKWWCHVLQG